MLTIVIPARDDLWDEKNERFITTKEYKLRLEHSLVSISKWESKWHKPFFSTQLTDKETRDYIRCMTITQNIPPEVYSYIDATTIGEIQRYMDDPMTATTFTKIPGEEGDGGQFVTSELIYYQMIALEIPVEFQNWHINRLMALIKLCNRKNTPAKKMSQSEILRRNAELNELRKKQWGTKG